jgi:DNA modification methylase
MQTQHRIRFRDAADLSSVGDGTIQLVVTSPPYPMVEMWDQTFSAQDTGVGRALADRDGRGAFARMHDLLDRVWRGCFRVLCDGGFLCVNVGDATRSIGGTFSLFTNHARVTHLCESAGFTSLPPVIWRKPTNAPTKFMGSGMLPAGAYLTLEHEYVLIFRKRGPRRFSPPERERRRRSALFWEERNVWYSDLWEIVGVRQQRFDRARGYGRARSGAFPFELAFRLVQMYSIQGDTILDPFLGTGTTAFAALASARSSIGYEIDEGYEPSIRGSARDAIEEGNTRQRRRLTDHIAFTEDPANRERFRAGHTHVRDHYPVVTTHERDIAIPRVDGVDQSAGGDLVLTAAHSFETCAPQGVLQ